MIYSVLSQKTAYITVTDSLKETACRSTEVLTGKQLLGLGSPAAWSGCAAAGRTVTSAGFDKVEDDKWRHTC